MAATLINLGLAAPEMIDIGKNADWGSAAGSAEAIGRLAASALGLGGFIEAIEMFYGNDPVSKAKRAAAEKLQKEWREYGEWKRKNLPRLTQEYQQYLQDQLAEQQRAKKEEESYFNKIATNRLDLKKQRQIIDNANISANVERARKQQELLKQKEAQLIQSNKLQVNNEISKIKANQSKKNALLAINSLENRTNQIKNNNELVKSNFENQNNILKDKVNAIQQQTQMTTQNMVANTNALKESYTNASKQQQEIQAALSRLPPSRNVNQATLQGSGKQHLELHAIIVKKPCTREDALYIANNITRQRKKKRFMSETEHSFRVRIVPKTHFDHFVSKVINPSTTLVFGY